MTYNYGVVNQTQNGATVVAMGGQAQATLLGAKATYDTTSVTFAGSTNPTKTGFGLAGDAGVQTLGASASAGFTKTVTMAGYKATSDGRVDTSNGKYTAFSVGAEAHLVQGSIGGDALLGPVKLGVGASACLVCVGANLKIGDGKFELGLAALVGAKIQIRYGFR